jgi:hypothetical protein
MRDVTPEQVREAVKLAELDINTISDATDITNPERRVRAAQIVRRLGEDLIEALIIIGEGTHE